jgi:hypothetical protein
VLQERIELSTSPLPRVCSCSSKGCKALQPTTLTLDLPGSAGI